MTSRNAVRLFLAGMFSLFVPVVAEWAGFWFPALAFLGWAGVLMIAGAALIGAAVTLEDRR